MIRGPGTPSIKVKLLVERLRDKTGTWDGDRRSSGQETGSERVRWFGTDCRFSAGSLSHLRFSVLLGLPNHHGQVIKSYKMLITDDKLLQGGKNRNVSFFSLNYNL